jgi:hypothetical protein
MSSGAEFPNPSEIVSFYASEMRKRFDFCISIFNKESEILKEHYAESNYELFKFSIKILDIIIQELPIHPNMSKYWMTFSDVIISHEPEILEYLKNQEKYDNQFQISPAYNVIMADCYGLINEMIRTLNLL